MCLPVDSHAFLLHVSQQQAKGVPVLVVRVHHGSAPHVRYLLYTNIHLTRLTLHYRCCFDVA